MGRLIYGPSRVSADMDDRTLAHLRIVFMTKLRRGESFMFETHLHDGVGGTTSLWISPQIPLVFHFYGSRQPSINRLWLEALINSSFGPSGLIIVPEPELTRGQQEDVVAQHGDTPLTK